MDTIEAILSRRSIRKFIQEPIPDGLIKELLKAAMNAPSARNQQPWQFIVINDRNILNEIPKIHPHSKMLTETPLAILVCGDKSLEKSEGYWVQDCSAATMNLLIAATAKGLGSVWLGIYPRDERIKGIVDILSLPDHITPLSLVALGYPAEKKQKEDRYNEERVHYNKW